MKQTLQPSPARPLVDVAQVLDSGSWNGWKIAVVVLAALAVVLDGFDNQVLGLAVPALVADWKITRSAFAPVFAVGFVGMIIGSAVAGRIGDRFGRRPALVACVLVFGLATLATAFAENVTALFVLRLISGAGLGGAIPMGGTTTAEFAPLRGRAMAVTLTIVCVPLGGVLVGTVASRVLQYSGWHTLFVIGGVLAIAIALLLMVFLPESPRFMAQKPERRNELIRLMNRFGHPVNNDTDFVAPAATHVSSSGFVALFHREYLRDTLSIWLAFIFCTMSVYIAFNWLPSLLASTGFTLSAASSGLATYNLGGVLGPLLCGALIARVGSRVTLLSASFFASCVAFVLGMIHPHSGATLGIFGFGLGVFGFFVNATQTLLYALATHIYPTRIRSTGVAVAAGVGRLGAILTSYIGPMVVQAGHASYFMWQVGAMAMAFVGIALISNHIPRLTGALTAPAGVAAGANEVS